MLGGWSIDPQVYDWIRENVPDGSTILELGSGNGTDALSKHYTMYSIEHNERFVGRFKSTYIHAPMKGHWYDLDVLERELEPLWGKYDVILIDGPIGNESKYRIGFWENITLFNANVLLIFDDTNRDGERLLFDKCLDYVNFDFGIGEELPEAEKRTFKRFEKFSVIFPAKGLEISNK